MKRLIKKLFLVSLLAVAPLAISGCGSKSKQAEAMNEPPVIDPELEAKFNSGIAALGAEEYKKAAQIFDSILVENPASEFDLIALFNSGAAYEGMQECKAGGRRYRQAAQTSAGRYPRIEAQAIFRLSYVYECLGLTEKVIASLSDAQRRKVYLPEEITHAEIPARLASAYAQLGQLDMAKKYFAKAEEGIKYLRRSNADRNDLIALLARTYYFMGRVQARQEGEVDPEAFFQSLRFQQTHLIKAVELSSNPWSRKAGDAILAAYRDMWEQMDAGRGRRAKATYQEKRSFILAWVEGALQAIKELQTLRFPGTNEGAEAKRMFTQLQEEQRRIDEFISEFAVSNPLTDEAQQRQGIKREGKVKGTTSPLEQEALKRGQQPKKGTK